MNNPKSWTIFFICLAISSFHLISCEYDFDDETDRNLVKLCATDSGLSGQCVLPAECANALPVLNDNTSCSSLIGDTEQTICCPYSNHTSQLPPQFPDCGRQTNFETIVGGQEVPYRLLPWMVQIYQVFSITRNNVTTVRRSFLCGGSLIAPQFVVTAGHCVYRSFGVLDGSYFHVKIGANRLSDNGTFYQVERAIANENYRNSHRYADIGLLKLSKPVNASHSHFVCLPSAEADRDDSLLSASKPLLVAGWGKTQFLGKLSDQLRQVDLQLLDNDSCNKSYTRLHGFLQIYPQGVDDRFICAGTSKGGKDACQGDSGGPLMSLDKHGNQVLVGLVSFGYKCAESDFPGIYTRVANYLEWIGERMRL